MDSSRRNRVPRKAGKIVVFLYVKGSILSTWIKLMDSSSVPVTRTLFPSYCCTSDWLSNLYEVVSETFNTKLSASLLISPVKVCAVGAWPCDPFAVDELLGCPGWSGCGGVGFCAGCVSGPGSGGGVWCDLFCAG